jgi:SLOG cluster2
MTGRLGVRFSGIAEEVMLALALRKPVYVLGGRGGGAQAVGQLLGFDSAVANPNTCLADDEVGESLSTREFTLPGLLDLPRTTPDLRTYLFERGITTNAWPRNGLSPEENRQVFKTVIEPDNIRDAESCVKQIIKGLLRLDGNTPSRPPL